MHRTPFSLNDTPHGPLRGDVYLPEESRGAPVVVGCHGFKGFKDWGFWPETADRLRRGGVAVVLYNASGSGIGEDLENFTEAQDFEQNTVTKELDDLGRILDAVFSRDLSVGGADARRLGVLGHSRGGGVAILRARRDPRIRSVVTWAAVSTFRRYSPEDVAEWKERGFAQVVNARTGQIFRLSTDFLDDMERHGDSYEPREVVRALNTPLLLIHGTRDETVPAEEAEILSRATTPGLGRLSLIPGAGHTFGAKHPFEGTSPELSQAIEKTAAWFHDTLA
jgi:dienelactone hydrolase